MFLKFHCSIPLYIYKVIEVVLFSHNNVFVCVFIMDYAPFSSHALYMLHLLVGSWIVGLMLTLRQYCGIVFIHALY